MSSSAWCVSLLLLLLLTQSRASAEDGKSYTVLRVPSQGDTIFYQRQLSIDPKTELYHVRDRYSDGQLQMDAYFSQFDHPRVKEEFQCSYRGHQRQGEYHEYYPDGTLRYRASFTDGLREGAAAEFAADGRPETLTHWQAGMLQGEARIWTQEGEEPRILEYHEGTHMHPQKVHYPYIVHTPKGYGLDSLRQWPLVIYLHGGSARGRDTLKMYSSGLPDQIYRGREFPFLVVSPQCPELLRWSTDDWFESFFAEVKSRYRVDSSRVYLTGESLGGAGTWYLAARYPGVFAAIAPIAGFTSRSTFLDQHLDVLADLPIWAFHGREDLVVAVSETERMIELLKERNPHLKWTLEPDVGHWIHWQVYPGDELYDWFLEHTR